MELTIGDLRPLEGAYTVHWAFSYDHRDRLVVYLPHIASDQPGGTVCVPVFRLATGFVILETTLARIHADLPRWNTIKYGYGNHTPLKSPELFAPVKVVNQDEIMFAFPAIIERGIS